MMRVDGASWLLMLREVYCFKIIRSVSSPIRYTQTHRHTSLSSGRVVVVAVTFLDDPSPFQLRLSATHGARTHTQTHKTVGLSPSSRGFAGRRARADGGYCCRMHAMNRPMHI